MSQEKPRRKAVPDSSPEPTLTYFEWVNGILEEQEMAARAAAHPPRKDEQSAA